MPSLPWSQSIAAGALFNPLSDWQYEYVPADGTITILHRATLVGLVATITSGSDTLQEEAPVPAGGTAGFTPSELDVRPITDDVLSDDRLKIRYRNPTAGAIVIDGIIEYTED